MFVIPVMHLQQDPAKLEAVCSGKFQCVRDQQEVSESYDMKEHKCPDF